MIPDLAYYEMRGNIALVYLNNPPMNALDPATKQALGQVFAELDQRCDEIRAVVLAGAGEKAFAAGADIKSFPELTPETAKRRLMDTHRIYATIEGFVRPVIAAIHGYCLGGGLELALCCDVRYASSEASFGFPEVKLSIFPGNGGSSRALFFLGLGRYKELAFSGDMIDARQALAYGLLEKVVEPGQHLEAAIDLAGRIARRGPLGVAMAKQAINRARDLALAESLEMESDLWSSLTVTHDFQEGARSFMEKRKPVYTGR